MNPEVNAIPESHVAQQAAAPAALSTTRPLYWSVRRELWEYRSIYIAPLAVAAVFLFGYIISLTVLRHHMHDLSSLSPMQQHLLFQQPYSFVSLLLMLTTFLIAVFYSLDALYGERRDRSLLFWKSLPVSDLTAVLSKALIPLVVIPLVTFVITFITQLIMLLMGSVILPMNGVSAATLWNNLSFFQMALMLLYHLLAIHGLWYAPVYAWLLLVSSWARRTPFLWAVLPPIVLIVVEFVTFRTTYLGSLLANRISGGSEGAAFTIGAMSMEPMSHISPIHFLLSSGLWIGLAIAAIFLAIAIQMRRYRESI